MSMLMHRNGVNIRSSYDQKTAFGSWRGLSLGLGFSAEQAAIAGVNGRKGGKELMMGFGLGSEGGAADALGVCAGLW